MDISSKKLLQLLFQKPSMKLLPKKNTINFHCRQIIVAIGHPLLDSCMVPVPRKRTFAHYLPLWWVFLENPPLLGASTNVVAMTLPLAICWL